MGITEILEDPKNTFLIGLPVGFFGGNWIRGQITGYFERVREANREDIKHTVREVLTTQGYAQKTPQGCATPYGNEAVLAAIDRLNSKLDKYKQATDSRVEKLEQKILERA